MRFAMLAAGSLNFRCSSVSCGVVHAPPLSAASASVLVRFAFAAIPSYSPPPFPNSPFDSSPWDVDAGVAPSAWWGWLHLYGSAWGEDPCGCSVWAGAWVVLLALVLVHKCVCACGIGGPRVMP